MCETIKIWGVLPLLYLRGKLLNLQLDFDIKLDGIQIYMNLYLEMVLEWLMAPTLLAFEVQ